MPPELREIENERVLIFEDDGPAVRDILAHPGEPPCGGAFMLTLDNTNDCR